MGSEQQMGLNPMPFLLAEDLSAIGTMSLGVAIPILAAFGVVTANLPTQIFFQRKLRVLTHLRQCHRQPGCVIHSDIGNPSS